MASFWIALRIVTIPCARLAVLHGSRNSIGLNWLVRYPVPFKDEAEESLEGKSAHGSCCKGLGHGCQRLVLGAREGHPPARRGQQGVEYCLLREARRDAHLADQRAGWHDWTSELHRRLVGTAGVNADTVEKVACQGGTRACGRHARRTAG